MERWGTGSGQRANLIGARPWKACEGLKEWPQGRVVGVQEEVGLGKAVGGLTRQEHWRQGLELDKKLVPSS